MRNLLLPALTLGVYVSGIFARFLRASLVSELRADYVRTARSKGLKERTVVGRHVMRNALLPFVTIVGLMLANFIGGAVVTEAVFTYPGLGRLLIQAISTRDYPLIQGCILVILVIYVVVNVLVDVLYAYIDPRIEYG
jgi:peptide/nickel transport system permease protein